MHLKMHIHVHLHKHINTNRNMYAVFIRVKLQSQTLVQNLGPKLALKRSLNIEHNRIMSTIGLVGHGPRNAAAKGGQAGPCRRP